MKGIVIEGLEDFPSLSLGAVQTFEDTVRFGKRNLQGKMIRRTFVGTIVKIECKWNLLTGEQFAQLHNVIRGKWFNVRFPFLGTQRTGRFYSGNISAQPFMIKTKILSSVGTAYVPRFYKDVSFSIISEDSYK